MRHGVIITALIAGCAKAPPALVVVPPVVVVEPPPPVEPTFCFDGPTDPDDSRVVLVSHPFGGAGINAQVYEVLRLSSDGVLFETGIQFEMGRAYEGTIHFSPDGRLGIAVQDDGTLGLFRVSATGVVSVIDARFQQGGLYVTDIRFDTDNERVWMVDGNWPNNGGGVYASALDCDSGELGAPILITESKLANTLIQTDAHRAILVASQVGEGLGGVDVHVFDMMYGDVVSSQRILDDRAIRSGVALVGDEWLLIGDNSAFSGAPNRVAVARIGPEGLEHEITFDIEDPFDIAASPYGNAALVSSGIRNAMIHLRYDGQAWQQVGVVARPRLPGNIVTINTGHLRGLVLVAENLGIHLLRFTPQGDVIDQGVFLLGSEDDDVVGTIGVQP